MSRSFVKLKRMASVSYGLGQPPPLAIAGVPILRATNIKHGQIDGNGLIFATREDLPLDRAPLLRAGEVLVVRSGAYTGDSALVTSEWAGAAPGYDLRLSPSLTLEPRFLAYSLIGQLAVDHMALSSSRAAQPHLNAEDLGEIAILMVSPRRQRAIADFLDAETGRIDALIEKKLNLGHANKARLDGVREEAIWRPGTNTLPLMHRTDPIRPIMYGIVLPGPNVDDGVYIVKGGDVAADFARPLCRTTTEIESGYARSRLRAGDLTFAIRGGIGDVAQVPVKAHGANITQDVARVAPAAGTNGRWLYHVLKSPGFQAQAKAMTTGATIRGLNIYDLKRLSIPDVSLIDQNSVARELDQVLAHFHALEERLARQVELLQEHRQALITAAVTGELEVPSRVGGDAAGSG